MPTIMLTIMHHWISASFYNHHQLPISAFLDDRIRTEGATIQHGHIRLAKRHRAQSACLTPLLLATFLLKNDPKVNGIDSCVVYSFTAEEYILQSSPADKQRDLGCLNMRRITNHMPGFICFFSTAGYINLFTVRQPSWHVS